MAQTGGASEVSKFGGVMAHLLRRTNRFTFGPNQPRFGHTHNTRDCSKHSGIASVENLFVKRPQVQKSTSQQKSTHFFNPEKVSALFQRMRIHNFEEVKKPLRCQFGGFQYKRRRRCRVLTTGTQERVLKDASESSVSLSCE